VRLDTREGQTFLDEWHRDAFTTRIWPFGSGPAYDLNPGESFRDYALWYYKKMLDTFADAIYWDDTFMQSCFDVVGTEAYELPDGRIQPSSGLFDMRELIRRTAVLQHELGRTGRVNMPHMTNTGIAPILSFAGTQLSWEDKNGARITRTDGPVSTPGRKPSAASMATCPLFCTSWPTCPIPRPPRATPNGNGWTGRWLLSGSFMSYVACASRCSTMR